MDVQVFKDAQRVANVLNAKLNETVVLGVHIHADNTLSPMLIIGEEVLYPPYNRLLTVQENVDQIFNERVQNIYKGATVKIELYVSRINGLNATCQTPLGTQTFELPMSAIVLAEIVALPDNQDSE